MTTSSRRDPAAIEPAGDGRNVDPGDRIAMVSILFVGVLLRIWQFAGNAFLWVDEIAVAENVLRRPWRAQLLSPPAFDQIVPPGFLLATKGVVSLLGTSDLALRLFPLLCALASVFLFASLAKKTLPAGTALFAAGLFSLGVPFIQYGAQVKQYSTDVALSLLLTLLAVDLHRNGTGPQFFRAGVIGAVVVWFSQTAVLMLAGLGMGLVLLAVRRKTGVVWLRFLGTMAVWAAVSSASVFAARLKMTPALRAYLHRFWYRGFPPGARSAKQVLWLPRALLDFWQDQGLGYPLPAVYLILMVLGLWVFWNRRRQESVLLLFAPVLVTLLAAAAQQYPFVGRLILFLAPAFLLAAAQGAGLAARWLWRVRVLPAVTLSVLALPPILALAQDPPVYRPEETKPMFAYIAARRQPGDAIYVYYRAAPAFRYYAPRFGLDSNDVLVGGCHGSHARAYLRELDRFRGRPRVWVLFAHPRRMSREEREMLIYLRRIGSQGDRFVMSKRDPFWVRADLFDLSIPERLAAASAEASSMPRDDEEAGGRFDCRFGPLAPWPISSLGPPEKSLAEPPRRQPPR